MKTKEEIKERKEKIIERLRHNAIHHNLSVHLENQLIFEYNTLRWVLEGAEDE